MGMLDFPTMHAAVQEGSRLCCFFQEQFVCPADNECLVQSLFCSPWRHEIIMSQYGGYSAGTLLQRSSKESSLYAYISLTSYCLEGTKLSFLSFIFREPTRVLLED